MRVAFDEGSLTGKWNADTRFAADDFRSRYFAGDRLERAVNGVAAVEETIGDAEPDPADRRAQVRAQARRGLDGHPGM